MSSTEAWLQLLVAAATAGLLTAAGFLSLRWWLTRRTAFHLLVALLCILAAVISLLVPFRYTDGWMVQAGILVLLAGSFWLLSERQPNLRETVLTAVCVSLAGGLALAALLFGSRQHLTNRALTENLAQAVEAVTAESSRLDEAAATLAESDVVEAVLAGTDETARLQQLLVEHELDYVIVTTPDGQVRARAASTATGDQILTEHPWFLTVLQGERLAGRAVDRAGVPLAVAGVPVIRRSAQVGAILAARSLADRFLADLPVDTLAVGTDRGTQATTAATEAETRLLQSDALDALIRDHAILADGPRRFASRFIVEGTSYRVSGMTVDSLSRVPLVFVTTSIPVTPPRSTAIAWIIAVLAMGGAAGAAASLHHRVARTKGGQHA